MPGSSSLYKLSCLNRIPEIVDEGQTPILQQERVAQALSLPSRPSHRTSTKFFEIATFSVVFLCKRSRGKEWIID